MSPFLKGLLAIPCIALFLSGCGDSNSPSSESKATGPLFELRTPEQTGLQFTNTLQESDSLNYFNWMYVYNGTGVAIGDINNDQLPDIYLTGNQVPNKLFLNKGGLKFEDITAKAGVAGSNWSTGVTMADVNGDGFLDIYVVRGGRFLYNAYDRTNLLFINNGNLTFTEQAEAWACNDAAFGTHATFFDYDLDGDLDLYTCNHPYQFGVNIDFRLARHFKPGPFESGRFFRNEGDKFTDITETSGIHRFAFGLSATAGDLNQDGYPDLYVANDFSEPDFIFINQKDGTFKEQVQSMTGHISNFGMGNDIADYNNDGLLDVMVLDMMAEKNRRKKTNMSGMNPEIFWKNVGNGFHYQYMQNTLLLNQGNGWFSDVAQMAGVSTTDWSWAPLFADFDNDGWQDLFVTNGFRRDARDNDFIKSLEHQDPATANSKTSLGFMPEEKLANYMFRNNSGLTFSKVTSDWGLDQLTWSNGAAYADLDNDGDLDLVVCNLDAPASLYENRANQVNPQNWLRVRLIGEGKNRNGLGAKVKLYKDKQLWQVRELTLSRGYQSSVEPILHFGLAELEQVEKVEVIWPNGKQSVLDNVKANQVIELKATDAKPAPPVPQSVPAIFTALSNIFDPYKHQETPYDDFKKEILLPHRQSQLGPSITVGDLNNDGLIDCYVGQAKGNAGWAFLQQPDGSFKGAPNKKTQEETGAAIFDADGDGKNDLLTLSATSEVEEGSTMFDPQLYLAKNGLPLIGSANLKSLSAFNTAASTAAPADFDGDGDQDLLIAGRMTPGRYPFAPKTFLLENDGKGNFTDVTAAKAPALARIGMVTEALWLDLDSDKDLDLVLSGEWMPITFFRNDGGKFTDATQDAGLATATGWWFSLAAADLDGDGDQDLVAGNMGLNSKYPASDKEPFHIYCHDFDRSGSLDIVLGYYNEGQCFPVRGRTCSSQQMPFIKEKFPTYKAFGNATLRDIYGNDLDSALHYQATTLASTVFLNDGKGKFTMQRLPEMAQLSAINGILIQDFSGDGKKDLLVAGNLHTTEVETSRADASVGLLLQGNGKGGFIPIAPWTSGFFAPGDIKDLALIPRPNTSSLIVATVNDGPLKVWEVGNALVK